MKEKLIVAYYSDKPIKNSLVFKRDVKDRFKIEDEKELSRLYTQVVNYQIKKYGSILYRGFRKRTKSEESYIRILAKRRRLYKRSGK